MTARRRIAIIGGGLAGLAAAARLVSTPLPDPVEIQIFESKRFLGGRAGSFVDRVTGESIDHCQHVAMGCCDQFLNYCEQTETLDLWQQHRTLHFFGPDNQRYDFSATPLLPAPLHLATSLLRMSYLSWRSRWEVIRALGKLARLAPVNDADEPSFGAWLRAQRQSEQAIERFWSVTVISALSETVDRTSLSAARKLFVDGFMRRRNGYHVITPSIPLGQWHQRVAEWLLSRGVTIQCGCEVKQIEVIAGATSDERRQRRALDASDTVPAEQELEQQVTHLQLSHEPRPQPVDEVILAVPWYRVSDLIPTDRLFSRVAGQHEIALENWESGGIASLHLWFDRPISELPHAVFIDRTVQWVFAGAGSNGGEREFHYQVVLSAAHELLDRDRERLKETVLRELGEVWPQTRVARLTRWRLLHESQAVFSPRPGHDRRRPDCRTAVSNLLVAGDWTSTGWPATMESAIRSGYAAADELQRRTLLSRG